MFLHDLPLCLRVSGKFFYALCTDKAKQMKQLTDFENKRVELGMAAEKLTTDPTFSLVMTELGNAYMAGIVNSKDDETKEREGFYHSIKALQDIGKSLTHWVQVKENIIANANADDHTEEYE